MTQGCKVLMRPNVNSHIYQQRFSLQRLKSVSQNVNGSLAGQVRKFCATLNSPEKHLRGTSVRFFVFVRIYRLAHSLPSNKS